MNSIVNKKGIEVKVGDYWIMVCPPNMVRRYDETWIMKITNIQDNGLVPVRYVNWKRKGKGMSYSRMISDFGFFSNLRKATINEMKYFDDRIGQQLW